MSLYNELAEKIAREGLSGSLRGAVSRSGKQLGQAVGLPSSLAPMVAGASDKWASALGNRAARAVDRAVSSKVQDSIRDGARIITDLLAGSNLDLLPGYSGMVNLGSGKGGLHNGPTNAADAFRNRPNPLTGGVTPALAERIYRQARAIEKARKNLWLLEVSSALSSAAPERFNLLATEVEYTPFNLSGERRRIGGAQTDAIQGVEPVEMRITTFDDIDGTLRKWFAAHHSAAVARDGTVGVPANYAITITVLHGVPHREATRAGVAYRDTGLFRTTNLDVSLSRSEDAMMQITMSFAQLDTFMRP